MNSVRGMLLIEVLLAIAFMAALVAIGTQVTLVSLSSTTASEEKDVAHRLAREMLEGARLASMSDWHSLAYVSRAGVYHATTTASSSWAIAGGVESRTVGSHTYTSSFHVASTSRDFATHNLEESYDAAHDDPSTLKVTATVSSDRSGAVTLIEYITRWHNVTCAQTEWNTLDVGATESASQNCTGASYTETVAFPAGTVETTGGTILLAP
ncbi:hypothetical protein A3C89_03975 [Candidatus Kaiserbacteria bacterium RIFCSPHIGHO2_02_FULL_50_50]|uniref:Uncharacterized protein n=1 Tax=Candidatus Kaiserbacteria bacterium RIFCSPHIGHO2_02_FULL_50_50 TaxID=1798492 RepID=A0A1F6DF24_9BACT|nr:MAG: hypothetical protein A3C89_03975 [Candidatus Kaiserbacteria bacterium RIFCSPHIGHO2_02_FULL_50_50]OGG88468.1 MAG: hypothetical protein A3G62_01940 [Candidatus Kaiserbacteria bacterium RIFCSPLOWO2_12_FULL_50_10]